MIVLITDADDNYFDLQRIPIFHHSFLQNNALVSCVVVKFLLKGFVTERMGEREDMQDAHVIMDDFKSEFDDVEIPHDV